MVASRGQAPPHGGEGPRLDGRTRGQAQDRNSVHAERACGGIGPQGPDQLVGPGPQSVVVEVSHASTVRLRPGCRRDSPRAVWPLCGCNHNTFSAHEARPSGQPASQIEAGAGDLVDHPPGDPLATAR